MVYKRLEGNKKDIIIKLVHIHWNWIRKIILDRFKVKEGHDTWDINKKGIQIRLYSDYGMDICVGRECPIPAYMVGIRIPDGVHDSLPYDLSYEFIDIFNFRLEANKEDFHEEIIDINPPTSHELANLLSELNESSNIQN